MPKLICAHSLGAATLIILLLMGFALLLRRIVKIRTAELVASKAQLQATMSAIPDELFELDMQGCYLDYHSPRTDLLVALPEVFIGKTVTEMLPSKAAGICMSALHEAEEKGYSEGKQIELTLVDGSHWFELSVAPKQTVVEPLPSFSYIILSRDITKRKQVELALERSEYKFRTLYHSSRDAIIMITLVEGFLGGNPSAVTLFGCSDEQEFIKLTPSDVSPELQPDGRRSEEKSLEMMQLAMDSGSNYFEWLHRRVDGSEFIADVLLTRTELEGKLILQATVRDITERKQIETTLRHREAQLNEAQRLAQIGSWELDISSNKLSWSDETFRIFEFNPKTFEANYQKFLNLVHPDDSSMVNNAYKAHLEKQQPYNIEHRLLFPSGRIKWVNEQCKTTFDESGRPLYSIGTIQDISLKKQTEAQIVQLAYFDQLTGLPNRHELNDRFSYTLSLAQRNNESMVLMFLDIDHFKAINDSLGHNVGDQLLQEVACRLKSVLRDEDTLSRLGGDEFVLLLPETGQDGAHEVAAKLIKVLNSPCYIEKNELVITISVGIAIYPHDGQDLETLSKNADTAMYRVKEATRNSFCFFTEEMQADSTRILEILTALRHALARNELQLHYQPQIDMQSGYTIGAEALLRWQHPELGLISPVEFIPIAESSGLIVPIGEWVLRTVANQLKNWIDRGLTPMVIAVNLSAVQFRHPSLSALVAEILHEAKLPAEYLELELTEAVAMDKPLEAIAIINELHQQGVRMSIDDFGTGYSSLSYLKKFKVYKLKIDQSFVRDICDDPDDKAIVTAIITLAKSLGMRTIAEGVETASQLNFLRSQGCEEVQGYYFSKPLPAKEFATFVKNQTTPN